MKTFLLLSLLLCPAAAAPTEDQPQAAEKPDEAAPVEVMVKNEEVSEQEASVGVAGDARFNPCPQGWFSHGSRCFLFVNTALNWYNAEEHCNGLGGHLASATNPREYSFLQQLTQMSSQSIAWLGGFNLQGQWMWIDREGFYYTNWYSPSSATSYPCMYLRSNSGWGNTRCSSSYRFICSKNAFGC